MLIFQLDFVSEVFLMDDVSVNYISIDKSDILNIHKYLMAKNNVKEFLVCLLYY